jgi:DNA (cytosine-5)-methyltransferase 1
MNKTKILNLYAGIGGNRKLWENVEVTAVEMNPDIAKYIKTSFRTIKLLLETRTNIC